MSDKLQNGNGKNSVPISTKTVSATKKTAGFLAAGFAILVTGYLLLVMMHSPRDVFHKPGDAFRTAVFHLQTIGIDKSDCKVVTEGGNEYGGYASSYDMVYTDEKHGKKLTVHVYDVYGYTNPWERGRHYSNIKTTDL